MDQEEDDILIHCAMRFDGHRYVERTGFDHVAAAESLEHAGKLPPLIEEQFTLFFMMQRFLMKWGGERLARNGPSWRDFRELFLRLASLPTPRGFAEEE